MFDLNINFHNIFNCCKRQKEDNDLNVEDLLTDDRLHNIYTILQKIINGKYNYAIFKEYLDNDTFKIIFKYNFTNENHFYKCQNIRFIKHNKILSLMIGYRDNDKQFKLNDKLLQLLERNL